MGCAEVISVPKVRARKHWATLRQQRHERFDQWLDGLEARLPASQPTLPEGTQAVWALRQQWTGSLTEAVIQHAYPPEEALPHAPCPPCAPSVTARRPVTRTLDTMLGPVQVCRPDFYCVSCQRGFYPLDETLELARGRKQFEGQQAAAQLATAVPYATAQTFFVDLTGVPLGTERMPTLTHQMAADLTVLAVAPSRQAITSTVTTIAAQPCRRPIRVLAIDGAHVPTRPATARGPRPGRQRQRAKRARWKGQYREAQGVRCYRLDGDRIVHGLSGHQVQDDQARAEALRQGREAGRLPEDLVRLCLVADGAPWIWNQVPAIFPHARQVWDYYPGAQPVHALATEQYGQSLQAREWTEATLARLFCGAVGRVSGGLKRMEAAAGAAAKAIDRVLGYLQAQRHRINYGAQRREGYPLGSGGIESATKFIGHVRLKRSGAWGYKTNSNQMLALRCAKYNGTFEHVFARYQQRCQEAKK